MTRGDLLIREALASSRTRSSTEERQPAPRGFRGAKLRGTTSAIDIHSNYLISLNNLKGALSMVFVLYPSK